LKHKKIPGLTSCRWRQPAAGSCSGLSINFDGLWQTINALLAEVTRRQQRNDSGVITRSSSGKVVFVEYDKWADYRGADEPVSGG
jgi:hypothetical protein